MKHYLIPFVIGLLLGGAALPLPAQPEAAAARSAAAAPSASPQMAGQPHARTP